MSKQTSEVLNATDEAIRTAKHAELELACVDLLCQLESLLMQAKEVCRNDQVEASPDIASKMLTRLLDFTNSNLSGEPADKTREEIIKVAEIAEFHQKVLGNRTWGETLRSMFKKDDVDYNSLTTHSALGKSLARVSARAFRNAILVLGKDSPAGRQLGQSTLAYIRQLEAEW